MKVEEAIDEALQASRAAAKLQAAQGQNPAVVRNRRRNVFLSSLRANGYVVVHEKPNRKILQAMIDCERGDYSVKEAWTHLLAAAQENDDGR